MNSDYKELQKKLKALAIYSLTALLAIAISLWSIEIWRGDIGIPFLYSWDAIFNLTTIKGLIENSWYLTSKNVGFPFKLESYDFPFVESVSLVILKAFAVLSNHFIAHNLFYILTFPLVAIAALFVLEKLGISSGVAIVISLLYTFIPYHFLRLGHLFLVTYYVVPLITLVIISLWSDRLPLLAGNSPKNKIQFDLLSKRSLVCILICILLGSTGIDYSFFSCFFITVACICVFLETKDRRVIVAGTALIIVISGTLLINLAPNLAYWASHGANHDVARRSPLEAEIYGLKIIYLLLPVGENRFSFLKEITERYNFLLPVFDITNEARSATLGLVGSIGFLSLIAKLFFSVKSPESREPFQRNLEILSILNIAAILFTTVGGVGAFFALIVSPQIRGLNRVSVFVAFFSLLAVALMLDRVQKRYIDTKPRRIIFNCALVSILVLGLLDQISPAFVPNYSELKRLFLNDQEFAHAVEKSVPQNSSIFQLPYVPYPEKYPPVNAMTDYDHFRPYLHAKTLKWSYGVMKGRHDWQESLVKEPLDIDIFLSKLAIIGFNGIYVDRNGYPSFPGEMEKKLQAKLGVPEVVSAEKRFAFYNISGFRNPILNRLDANQISEYYNKILYPVKVLWKRGFFLREENAANSWHWGKKKAKIVLRNPSNVDRKIQIKMSLLTGWSDYSKLHIQSKRFSSVVQINSTPSPFIQSIDLPAKSRIEIIFNSEARRSSTALQDRRELYFQVQNLEVIEDETLLKQAGIAAYSPP